MLSLSLRLRLTIWYTLALLFVLVVTASGVLWQFWRIGIRRVDRELELFALTAANMVQEERGEMPTLASATKTALDTARPRDRALAVLDDQGRVLGATWNGLILSDPLPSVADGNQAWTVETSQGPWRVVSRPRRITGGIIVMVVGAPLANVIRERQTVLEAMWVGIPIALFLTAAGGLWIAAVGLRPMTRMADAAADMSVSGTESLGDSQRNDELGRFARAFNGLLTRLRTALQTQRQFMADASHELRTPTSVIRSTVDVTLARSARDESEYREGLGVIGEQAQRMGRLVDDMLVLARADSGAYPLQPVRLYLDEIVSDCCRTVKVLAAPRGVTIGSASFPEVPFVGDEELLRRMLQNVMQNAAQHTPSGRAVSIHLALDSDHVAIRITDQGPGIGEADRRRIFDRFVQLDPTGRNSGSGLGLPIAKWIAEAHHGTLDLESSGPDGSTFCIRLPLREPAADANQNRVASSSVVH